MAELCLACLYPHLLLPLCVLPIPAPMYVDTRSPVRDRLCDGPHSARSQNECVRGCTKGTIATWRERVKDMMWHAIVTEKGVPKTVN